MRRISANRDCANAKAVTKTLVTVASVLWMLLSSGVGDVSGVGGGSGEGDARVGAPASLDSALQLVLQADPEFDPVRPSLVGHGDFITYTLTITNIGTEVQTQVVVSDGIPVGTHSIPASMRPEPSVAPSAALGVVAWEVAALNPGESFTARYTVRVNNTITVTAIVNNAFASSAETPQVQSNTTVHPFGVVEEAELRISLASEPPMTNIRGGACYLWSGSHVRYSLTVINSGPLMVDTVVVSASIPPGMDFVTGALYPAANYFDGRSFGWRVPQLMKTKVFTAWFEVRVSPEMNVVGFVGQASVESAQTAQVISNQIIHVFPALPAHTPTPPGAPPDINTYPDWRFCPKQLLYFPLAHR
jgi:uncharacterized repeat protein (TIGR01451 family)